MADPQIVTATPKVDPLAELKAQLEAAKAENARLLADKAKLDIRLAEKGGISIYFGGRFPVTLYVEQLNALLEGRAQILAFVEANKAEIETRTTATRAARAAEKVAAKAAKS
jgi:multidrug efflux pump subunit AcrA (membrane-fusion protein)